MSTELEVIRKPRRRKKATINNNKEGSTKQESVLVKLPPDVKSALAIDAENEERSQNAQARYYIKTALVAKGMLPE